MKYFIFIITIIVLGYATHLFLPWWTIVVIAGFVGVFTEYSGIRAFVLGFLSVALLWGLYAAFVNYQNEGIIANRLGALFGNMSPASLILITSLIGGLLGGLGVLTGNQGRKLITERKKT